MTDYDTCSTPLGLLTEKQRAELHYKERIAALQSELDCAVQLMELSVNLGSFPRSLFDDLIGFISENGRQRP